MTPQVCPACKGTPRLKRATAYAECSLYACTGCGTEFLSPQPSDERLGEIYSGSYYDSWAVGQDPVLESMKQSTFGWILDQCGVQPGARILDIGCATGFLLHLAEARGMQAWGIDLNKYAIEQCKELVAPSQVHCGVLADRPFDDTAFDAIFMIDFIEHVRDPEAELLTVAERLTDGGAAVISTPRAKSLLHNVARTEWPQYKEEHLTYFSLPGLVSVLQRCGFRIERARPTVKTVTLNYADRLMQAYHQPLATPLCHALWRALPWFRDTRVPLRLGEMTVVARKGVTNGELSPPFGSW
ncbi:MAG: hypothetical protein NVSMB32_02850 [Actinomycetota bacterium]